MSISVCFVQTVCFKNSVSKKPLLSLQTRFCLSICESWIKVYKRNYESSVGVQMYVAGNKMARSRIVGQFLIEPLIGLLSEYVIIYTCSLL